MRIALQSAAILAIGLSVSLAQSWAATVPFIEHFAGSVSNWGDYTDMALLTYVPAGGPDGSGYASVPSFVFAGAGGGFAGSSAVLFRAEDEFNSSGHAFEGNWISDGVGHFSAFVRHNAPLPLNFFTRFSGPGNYPGAIAVQFAPVLPGTWTRLEFDIDPLSTQFVSFEGTNFNTVFSNIGHIQIGVNIPTALASSTTPYTFDLDRAAIAPEPASVLLGAGAIVSCLLWRRRRAG